MGISHSAGYYQWIDWNRPGLNARRFGHLCKLTNDIDRSKRQEATVAFLSSLGYLCAFMWTGSIR